MRKGKYTRRRRGVSTKALLLTLAVMMIVGCTMGTTLAWLTDKTGEVVNTFTTSDVDISLVETEGGDEHTFKMVPGCTITKDPTVTVVGGSEECWLFVKVEESANFRNFMTYEIADGWTPVGDENNVWARRVVANEMGTEFSVLKDDKVSVIDSVTKTQMNALTPETYPTLTVTAYACQLYKSNGIEFNVADAWAQCPKGE